MMEAMPNGVRPMGSRSTTSLVMLTLTCVCCTTLSAAPDTVTCSETCPASSGTLMSTTEPSGRSIVRTAVAKPARMNDTS